MSRLPTLTRGHRAAPLVPTGMLQSGCVDAYNPPAASTPWERETIELSAKQNLDPKLACCPPVVPAGLVSLDWLHAADAGTDVSAARRDAEDSSDSVPICILIPSLTGDSRSPYLRRAATALRDAGLRVACYNPRGRGGNALASPFMYAAGYTGDLRRVIAHVRHRYPRAPLVGVGYSLGGVYLAKLLAEDGSRSALAGAVALASPIDIRSMARHLRSTWLGNLIDRFVIAPSVRDTLTPYVAAPGAFGDLEAARSARTLDRIDEGVLAPMMGCQSKEQYYVESTPALADVRVPLLMLLAENDPIKPHGLQQALEAATRDSGAPLVLAVTPEGGHSLTWPEGWRAEASWGERVVVEWARACGERATAEEAWPGAASTA